nr:nucleolar protein 3 isoform X1 [Pelodiscus sinensis]|eukprot:XP_025037144.1 nucleolar protein 3 isoform X1 [Pelodiscus sinensis]
MAAGDNSAVIRTRRKELIGIIQRDPESVLDELLAQSAISEEEYDSMNQMEDTVARIRKLLIYIQRRGEPACRIFLECLESLFPGTNQPWRPSEYDFFNPERDSRPVRNPEPRERDFFNPEHHPKVEEGDGLAPEQESETLRDPEPEEKEDFDPELEEGDGSSTYLPTSCFSPGDICYGSSLAQPRRIFPLWYLILVEAASLHFTAISLMRPVAFSSWDATHCHVAQIPILLAPSEAPHPPNQPKVIGCFWPISPSPSSSRYSEPETHSRSGVDPIPRTHGDGRGMCFPMEGSGRGEELSHNCSMPRDGEKGRQ